MARLGRSFPSHVARIRPYGQVPAAPATTGFRSLLGFWAGGGGGISTGNHYDDAVSLGRTEGFTTTLTAQFVGSAGVNAAFGFSGSGNQDAVDSFGLVKTLGVTTTSTIGMIGSVTISEALSITTNGGSAVSDSVGINANFGYNGSGNADIVSNFGINITLGESGSSILSMLDSTTLSLTDGISAASIMSMAGTLAISEILSIITNGGADVSDSVGINSNYGYTSSGNAAMDALFGISLALGQSTSSTLDLTGALTVSETLGTSGSDVLSMTTTLTLSEILSLLSSLGSNFQDSVGINANYGFSGSSIQALVDAFGLNETLGFNGVSTQTMLDSVTLAELFGFTASGASADTNWNVSTGTGYTDVNPKQLVRTSGNILYVIASNCDSYPCTVTSQTLRAYKANSTGVPSGFTRMDSAHEPSGIGQWAIAIDGSDVIHVVYNTRSSDGANLTSLKYTTFSAGVWGSVETIATINSSNVGQGDESVALALDSDGIPHIVYLEGSGTARRAYYRNRIGGTWSAASQVDTGVTYSGNYRAWQPNLAFDTNGAIVFAWHKGAFNGDSDGILYSVVRTSGSFGSTVQVATGLHVGIDQGASLVVTPDNMYHLTAILPESPDPSKCYIQYWYSTNGATSWSSNHPSNQATHNPSLGYANNKVRIFGHGAPDAGGHGNNLYYLDGNGGSGSWSAWTQFVTGNDYDSSVNTRWSQYFYNYSGTWDIAYWNDNYPNNLYTGTSVNGNSYFETMSFGRTDGFLSNLSVALSESIVLARLESISISLSASMLASVSIGEVLGIANSAIQSIADAVTVARTMGISDASILDMLGSVGLADILGILASLGSSYVDALAINRTDSLATTDTIAMLGDLTLPKTLDISLADVLSILASVGYSRTEGYNSSTGSAYQDSLGLARTQGVSTSALASFLDSLNFSRTEGVIVLAIAAYLDSVGLGRTEGSSGGDTISMSGLFTLARTESETQTAGFLIDKTLSISRTEGFSLSYSLTMDQAVTLAEILGISISSLAAYTDTVPLSELLGFVADSTSAISGQITLSENLFITIVGLTHAPDIFGFSFLEIDDRKAILYVSGHTAVIVARETAKSKVSVF